MIIDEPFLIILRHHQDLDVEGKKFTKALDQGVARGQLDRITGKSGITGTFQLVDGAKKFGTRRDREKAALKSCVFT